MFTAGPSDDLPYRLRPGLDTAIVGTPVRINALGLRGPETSATPAADTYRVLVLGDSVVFGWGVAEDATFPAVLAVRLAALRGTPVEALNAGVFGYDTVAEAAFLAGPGLALAPRAVVLGVSLNDYDMAPGYDATGVLTRRAPGEAPGAGLLARSEFFLLLRWIAAWSRGGLMTQILERTGGTSGGDLAAALDRGVAAEHQRFYAQPEPARWERIRAGLMRARDTSAAHGLPLVVVIFPEAWQLAAGDAAPQRHFAGLCTELALRCVDLLPAFRGAHATLFQDVQHPNADGLAIAAEVVAAALAR
jgi:hypothetical protein